MLIRTHMQHDRRQKNNQDTFKNVSCLWPHDCSAWRWVLDMQNNDFSAFSIFTYICYKCCFFEKKDFTWDVSKSLTSKLNTNYYNKHTEGALFYTNVFYLPFEKFLKSSLFLRDRTISSCFVPFSLGFSWGTTTLLYIKMNTSSAFSWPSSQRDLDWHHRMWL